MNLMNADEAAQAAIDLGFQTIMAYGGPVPLSEWQPYGLRTGHHGIYFRLDVDGERPSIRDVAENTKAFPPGAPTGGIWPLA